MCGDPGREASLISRGQRVTVFSWVHFSSVYFRARSKRKSQNLVEVFHMLAQTVFRFDTNKTNIKLAKYSSYKTSDFLTDLSIDMSCFHFVPSCRAYTRRTLFQFLIN